MTTEYNERVLDYQRIIYSNYIVEIKDDGGLQDHVKKVNIFAVTDGRFCISKQ